MTKKEINITGNSVWGRLKKRLRPTKGYQFLYALKCKMVSFFQRAKRKAYVFVEKIKRMIRPMCKSMAKRLWSCKIFQRIQQGEAIIAELWRKRHDAPRSRPTVSVIIPTYKPNPYIAQCVSSVLKQDESLAYVEVVICVNGNNTAYYEALRKTYAQEKKIKILYTPKAGAAAGRNLGNRHASGDYLTYLDDDDYLTPRYIRSMVLYAQKGVEFVLGKLVDFDEAADELREDTYLNWALRKSRGKQIKNIYANRAYLGSMCAKLYSAQFIKRCTDLDETLQHTEDIVFWADNIDKIRAPLAPVHPGTKEAYIRRLTPNSMSRPQGQRAFDFYITDRVALVERLSNAIFTNISFQHKQFILQTIQTQCGFTMEYFQSLSPMLQKRAREIIFSSTAPFFNKSKFSDIAGIAFCHNFPPYVDASAYVAAKRLEQINRLFGQPIHWTVFMARMQNRAQDQRFVTFYAQYQYDKVRMVGTNSYFNEASQQAWGELAFAQAQSIQADVIYSRSMWAGSHVAAKRYKQQYPKAKWYAEFSDPIYMSANGSLRPYAKEYAGDLQYLNTFWRDIEVDVMNMADVVIFTNEKQRDFMLCMNPSMKDPNAILAKSKVLVHPALPAAYAQIVNDEYPLNTEMIHVGYFGTFYLNRNGQDMVRLLERKDIVLHIFTPGGKVALEPECTLDTSRIQVNHVVDHLSFLHIAAKMDYLFLNDIDVPYPINPYLPSKLADYLSVGTPVIAKIFPNSPMANMEHGNLIKLEEIDQEFIRTMHRK